MEWTKEQLFDLVQEQMHKGNISPNDLLDAMGDHRPVKVVTRADISAIVQDKLSPNLEKLADVTDAVIGELERLCSPDDLSWDAIHATIDGVMGNL